MFLLFFFLLEGCQHRGNQEKSGYHFSISGLDKITKRNYKIGQSFRQGNLEQCHFDQEQGETWIGGWRWGGGKDVRNSSLCTLFYYCDAYHCLYHDQKSLVIEVSIYMSACIVKDQYCSVWTPDRFSMQVDSMQENTHTLSSHHLPLLYHPQCLRAGLAQVTQLHLSNATSPPFLIIPMVQQRLDKNQV